MECLEVREVDREKEREIDRLGRSTEAVKQTSTATGWNLINTIKQARYKLRYLGEMYAEVCVCRNGGNVCVLLIYLFTCHWLR